MVQGMAVPVGGEASGPRERRRFSVAEYTRMIDKGILAEGNRVELLDGVIYAIPYACSVHVAVVNMLTKILITQLADRAIVSPRNMLRLSLDSALEPDIAVLRQRHDYYSSAIPTVEDALLLIEVAHSTLRYDRDKKVPVYSRAGIPEVWIVDLEGSRVIVYRWPDPDAYEWWNTLRGIEQLAPEAFPDLAVNVADFLALPASK